MLRSPESKPLRPASSGGGDCDGRRHGPRRVVRFDTTFSQKGQRMSRIVKFGEDVDGYVIPVLNEREVRAAAGLLFVMMFVLVNVMNTYGPISGLICLACLIFLFFETAFGICLGCKVYALICREKAHYCPGEVCEVSAPQEIQKTSRAQLLIAVGLAVYVVLLVVLFHDTFSVKAHGLFAK
jgi:hypothetical protein